MKGEKEGPSRIIASVIIPNWNGARFLPTCLDSLRRQTFREFEILVVDNASSDDSVPLLRQHYPEVRLIRLSKNVFFSGAVNVGIRQACGEVIVLLNNDTEAEPQWLEELIEALWRNPEAGMAASKILLYDRRDVINSAGDYYRIDGVPGNRGVWEKDEGQYDNSPKVFGACGGAAAYRRRLFDQIDLFDEDLVGYCEDVDLSFRAQLAGFKCVFAPKARVYHRLSASGGGPLASYLCGRNFISVLVKNMPAELVLKHLFRILAAQVGYVAESLSHVREPAARARLRGQLAALVQLPKMIAKRRQLKMLRKVSNHYIESILVPGRSCFH